MKKRLNLEDRMIIQEFLREGYKLKDIAKIVDSHSSTITREIKQRSDNQRFYYKLKFYSLEDLRYQAKLCLKRSNNIPMSVLNYKTPLEQRTLLETI